MKKIIILIIFSIISMYYTNICLNILKDNDPIMKQIKLNINKYKVIGEDAKIIGNSIIPGKYGKEIDLNKTYSKMKKYGNYNETLMVMKEVQPTTSIENIYTHYIEKGNSNNKSVALIFTVSNIDNLNKLASYLKKIQVPVTIFIDGTLLELNENIPSSLKKYEIELLSYNKGYEKNLFQTALSYLENQTNKKAKYCYSEKENEEILNLCSSLKLHTIKPYLVINKNLFNNIKKNLSNSIIIKIDINDKNLSELKTSVDYITKKGYEFKKLDSLLSEKSN